jgi:serine/threonine protein kinase
MDDASQLVGQVLANTYKVVRPLGRGGMGAVFEATNVRIGKKFAIKVLSERVRADRQVLERFRREALIATDIGHPHIVEVIDFDCTDDGLAYMVMEFLQGQDLSVVLNAVGPLPVERAVHIAGQICSALHAAHQHNVVHRDLKPANIFLCRDRGHDDFVKVLDFGISKILGAASNLTSGNTVIGTPCYMAPEQAESRHERVGPWTDVFALGTMLYQVLSGEQPFIADSTPALLYKIVRHRPPALDELRPTIPGALAAVVAKAMEKRPEDRFASMRELAEQMLMIVPEYTGPGRLIWQRREAEADVAALSETQPAHSSDASPPAPRRQPEALSTTTLNASAGENVVPIGGKPRPWTRPATAVGIGAAVILALVAIMRVSSTKPDESRPGGVPPPAAHTRPQDAATATDGRVADSAPAADTAPVADALAADRTLRAKIRRRPRSVPRPPDARVAPPSPATRSPDARPRPRAVPGVTPEW